MRSVQKTLLVVEIVLCFALPIYMLFWGIISIPLWVGVVERGGDYALWHLFDIAAGCAGAAGLVSLLRFLMSNDASRPFRGKVVVVLASLGLLGVWGGVTDHFSILELNGFVVLSAVLPTFCTAHLLVLAFRRARLQMPNNALHATREDARA
jgi:hypothetical protein